MSTQEYHTLLKELTLKGKLSLKEGMNLLGVSESTVRRLFMKLEDNGKAIRSYGGIQYISSNVSIYDFSAGAQTNMDKKKAIAKEAVHFVNDGDVIFCDSGTTIQCFCSELAARVRREGIKVEIYTNSIKNLEILGDVTPVCLIGGRFRQNRQDFCGFLAERSLEYIQFDKCFVSADACIDARSFATTDFDTVSVNLAACRNASKNIMLIDSTKFQLTSHIHYININELYCVVTDSQIDPETLKKLKHHNTRIVCAKTDS